jgi:methionyl-tRNA synthetase
VHLIGKEILWFHTFYWPAMLLSLDLPLPKCVYAHGWWTAEGKKMSKSLGNFIDLDRVKGLAGTYSLDALRFYLLRAAPFGSDLDFSESDFAKSFAELGNVLGNCLNRVLKMVNKYREGVLPAMTHAPGDLDQQLMAAIQRLPGNLKQAFDRLELQQCVLLPIELARQTNGYIDATAPFSLAKDAAKRVELDTVLHLSAQAIAAALTALLPVLPKKATEGLRQLGVDPAVRAGARLWDHLPLGHKVGEGSPLFPRVA